MRMIAAIGFSSAVLASAALAAPKRAVDAPPPAVLKSVQDCRTITDNARRLECYDAAVGALDAAIEAKTMYVLDRTEVAKTRKSLFGLTLPNLNLFGDSNDDPNAIQTVEATIRSASSLGDGNWTMSLDDGTNWVQTDGLPLALEPRAGRKVVIKRAALGSYKMRVDNQPAVRVRRTL